MQLLFDSSCSLSGSPLLTFGLIFGSSTICTTNLVAVHVLVLRIRSTTGSSAGVWGMEYCSTTVQLNIIITAESSAHLPLRIRYIPDYGTNRFNEVPEVAEF